MRVHRNVSSKQVVQRLTKIRNTPNFFTHIVTQIMHKIFLIGALSPQHITSSTALLLTGSKRNNLKHSEAFSMHKREQCTQLC